MADCARSMADKRAVVREGEVHSILGLLPEGPPPAEIGLGTGQILSLQRVFPRYALYADLGPLFNQPDDGGPRAGNG